MYLSGYASKETETIFYDGRQWKWYTFLGRFDDDYDGGWCSTTNIGEKAERSKKSEGL